MRRFFLGLIGLFLAFVPAMAQDAPIAAVAQLVMRGTVLLFGGMDPVSLFPGGIKSPMKGELILGKREFTTTYTGFNEHQITLRFASQKNMIRYFTEPVGTFTNGPVGWYCLGAMARGEGDVVLGKPLHSFFVQGAGEHGMWALFGSENGPIAWAKMTVAEQGVAYAHAVKNYNRLTGQKAQPLVISGQ